MGASSKYFRSDRFSTYRSTEWITHTPAALVKSHLRIDQAIHAAIPRQKEVNVPA
jgi:hypothetical protein